MTQPTAAELLSIYTDYTAAAKREYDSARSEHRFNYLNGVAELSGMMIEDLPRPGDMPVYIGRMRELTDKCSGLLDKAMSARVEFVVLPYSGHPHSLRNITKPDDPVFAFFPGEFHIADAQRFLTELAALSQPPAPVVEVVGTLGDLTPNQVRAYASKGVLRLPLGWRSSNRDITQVGAGDNAYWNVTVEQESQDFLSLSAAYRYWSDVQWVAPVEFIPNPKV